MRIWTEWKTERNVTEDDEAEEQEKEEDEKEMASAHLRKSSVHTFRWVNRALFVDES